MRTPPRADADEGWHVDDLGLTAAAVVRMVEKNAVLVPLEEKGPELAELTFAWLGLGRLHDPPTASQQVR